MTNNLPDNSYKTQIFYQSGTWVKPMGISMIYITAIGGGGGGGGGQTSASGAAGTGGGGGGGGVIMTNMIISDLSWDALRITVGIGGSGGGANTDGTTGGDSIIQPSYRNDATGTLIIVRALGARGGTAGSGGGTAGPGGVVPTSLQSPYSLVSLNQKTTGPNGTAGVSAAAGTSYTYGTTSATPTTGGAAGGGKNTSNVGFSGGSIVGAGFVTRINGGAVNSNGENGSSSITPFYQLGGTGGGGNGSGTGGTGGNGSYGSGGGGGGAGTTGGTGGKGGDGIVIINCW